MNWIISRVSILGIHTQHLDSSAWAMLGKKKKLVEKPVFEP